MRALERFQGRKFDYTPRNALEDRYANYPTEAVERVRRQVSLSALQGLAVKLGALREGRKAIMLRQRGLRRDAAAADARRDRDHAGRRQPRAATTRSPARTTARGPGRVPGRARRAERAAARCSTPPTAATPPSTPSIRAGCRPASSTSRTTSACAPARTSLRQTQNTLRTLADETDGRAIVNRNDLGQGHAAARRATRAPTT